MPVAPPASTSWDDDEPPQRSHRLLVVLVALGAISVVIAALVIISSGPSPTTPKPPQAQVRADDASLVMGPATAPTKVVVYEDFGSPESRSFEIASRDFLRGAAAQESVVVEYHPVALLGGYSADALTAWGGVLRDGRAAQALAFHDLLFDRQPGADDPAPREFIALAKKAGVKDGAVLDAVGTPQQALVTSTKQAAARAGVRTTPSVWVDGRRIAEASPVALADQVQRMVLKASGT